MSPSEVVASLYDALGRGDAEGARRHLHPAVRWYQPQGMPSGQEYRGQAAVEAYLFRTPVGPWTSLQSRTDSLHESGELVFMRGAYIACAAGIPRDIIIPFIYLFEVRGGLIEACHEYTDTARLRDTINNHL